MAGSAENQESLWRKDLKSHRKMTRPATMS